MSVIAYERRRIRSIRSTWIIIGITLALVAAFTAITAYVGNYDPVTGGTSGQIAYRDLLGGVANPITLVPLSVLAAMAFGGEYRFGLIRLTLTSFPSRLKVLLAKLGVVTVWIVGIMLAALVVAAVVALIYRNNVEFAPFAATNVLYALRVIVYGLVYSLLAFALVLITRNQALSIIVLALWGIVIEQLFVGLLGSRFEWLTWALPVTGGYTFVMGESDMWQGLATFAGTAIVLMLAGWALFSTRDA